ncbi:MAG: efflux RND transporter permease subunit, partial [Spirochaetales bacterium]
MRNLVSFCLNRPVTTIMLYLGLAIFGVMAGLSMDQAFLPDIPVPKLLISAAYPGMPPAEVRELISIPLEDTLSSLRGIRHISSLSRQGSSILTLEFQWGRDMVLAAAETRELLDAAYALLPAGAEKPAILPVDPGDKPVLCFGIFPLKGDLAAARRLCELEIKTRLQQVEGVGMVGLSGGVEEEMQVLVDQQRAVSAGVSLGYISSVLTASAVSMPAGILKEGTVQYIVKTDGRISDAAALAGLLIPLPDGSLIPLGDLAEVRLALRDQESCFLVDAEEGIGLTVHGQKGYSPVRLAAGVREELDAVRKIYSGNLSITPVYDQSGVISASLK